MSNSHAELILLDGSSWTGVLDFYDAVLKAVGAPDWHGRSVNALKDSLVFGGINQRNPPYHIVILRLVDKPVIEHIDLVREALVSGRAEFRCQHGYDVIVSIRLEAVSDRDRNVG